MAIDESARIFDLLWAPASPVKRGPRPSLTLDAIVRAAIDIADREGLEAVTMQRLATTLNSKAMSLYRYVPGKDAILELMWDAALGRAPDVGDGNWREKLSNWAAASFRRLERHPWLIELVGAVSSVGPRWAGWLDAGLTAQSDLPLTTAEKLAVLTLVDGHMRSTARVRLGVKASPQWAAQFGRMLETTATDSSFPTLGKMTRGGDFAVPGLSMEQMFDFGLERILDGIAAYGHGKAAVA